jgi:hypothetical protein
MRLALLSGIVLVSCLAACDDGDSPRHVELSGKLPAEGSALAADALCDQATACGTVSIGCAGGSDGFMDCTATINHRTYDACYTDVRPDIEQTLACPELTPALIDMMEQCIDAWARQPCLTQAQADALAAQAEANGGMIDLDPPECAFLDDPNTAPGC